MRDVRDNLDLAELQKAGKGFISNARKDGIKLHRAGCEAVGAMVSTAYPKKFFDACAEAEQWLDKVYGSSGWYHCGICHPELTSDLNGQVI
jgi:hypothetical protein